MATSAIIRVCRLRPDSAAVRESGVAGDFTEAVLFEALQTKRCAMSFTIRRPFTEDDPSENKVWVTPLKPQSVNAHPTFCTLKAHPVGLG
ncbi:hypothetical protein EMIT0P171_250041 [Pseudomonas sp. IT-P171]